MRSQSGDYEVSAGYDGVEGGMQMGSRAVKNHLILRSERSSRLEGRGDLQLRASTALALVLRDARLRRAPQHEGPQPL